MKILSFLKFLQINRCAVFAGMMMDGIKKFLFAFKYIFVVLGLLYICLVPQITYAMVISPVAFDISVDQDVSIEREIVLKNDTKQRAVYAISSENFVSQGEEGGQMYVSEAEQTDLASWVSWSNEKVVVGPGSNVRVPIVISVPKSAEPGGHYATVFFSRINENIATSTVGITEQIGVLLLVRVSGEITERAGVRSFELRAPSDGINRLPAVFDVRIQNEGSVHIRPEGNIVITNMLGRVVAKLPLNSKNGAVLPGGIRHFETEWIKTEDQNIERGFWSEVKLEWKYFRIGRYTAEIHATYGLVPQEFSRLKEVFWVLPWHLMLVVFAVILLFICLIKVYTRCLICRLIKKSDAKNKARRIRS